MDTGPKPGVMLTPPSTSAFFAPGRIHSRLLTAFTGWNAECCTVASHEFNGWETFLDLFWDVQHLKLRVELFRPSHMLSFLSTIKSPDRDMLFLSRSLINIVTCASLVHSWMMHLHTEHFPSARIRNRVRWQDDDFSAWLHKLHAAISLNLSEWGSDRKVRLQQVRDQIVKSVYNKSGIRS